jgi:hypothetical protein
MKKYTQRELCYEAFGDVMRGLGNVAKAGAKLAVPAGAELVNRGKAAVNTFTQQQPVKAIIEYFKKINSTNRYIGVYKKDVKVNDIVLGRVTYDMSKKTNYRLTEPTAFKERKKYGNILLVDFNAKDFETGLRGEFIAYLVKDESGKVGYNVFAIQEYGSTAIDPDEILPPEERRRPSPIAIKGPIAPKTRLAGPTVPRIYDRAAIDV